MEPGNRAPPLSLTTRSCRIRSGFFHFIYGGTAFGDTFSSFDENGDGVLDESEWESAANDAWGGAPGGGDDDGPVFGLLDTTDDNQVGQDEYFSEQSFEELDDDENGVLDDEEFGV